MNDTTSMPVAGFPAPVVLPEAQPAWPEFDRLARPQSGLDDYLRETAALLAEMLDSAWYAWGEVSAARGTVEWHHHDPAATSANDGAVRQRIFDGKTSAAGFAIAQQRPILVNDFNRESRFDDSVWRRRRASSGVFCPLVEGETPLGMIAVLSSKVQAFAPALLPGADAIAHLAVATVARARAEEALGREQRINQSLWQSMPALMISLTPDGKIERLNRSAETTTGFTHEEIQGRTMWGALLIPEEVCAFREALERLRRGDAEVQLECFILTKQGERRRVSWVLAGLRNAASECESLVASGIDITEKFAVIERMAQMTRAQESAGVKTESPPEIADQPAADSEAARAMADKQNAERRRSQRRAYPYVQAVAPVVNERLPQRSLFREVRCRDISPSGFSYLSPIEPKHRQVVVAFGSGTRLIYLKAEIVHTSPTRYNGVGVFHVGCRYLGRVEL